MKKRAVNPYLPLAPISPTVAETILNNTGNWTASKSVFFQVSVDLPLYLYYQGKEKIDLLDFTFREGGE